MLKELKQKGILNMSVGQSLKSLSRYMNVLRLLAPYLLKNEDRSIRKRFYLAQSLVLATIILNVLAPILYGYTVDIFKVSRLPSIVICVLLAYGLTWTLSQALVQVRGMIAFKVVRRVIRQLNHKAFCHLHNLSLRYHLDRKTGSITTSIDRIEYSVTTLFWHILFYLIPTIIEVVLILVVLMISFEWYYAAILLLGIVAFVGFTLYCTLWDTNNLQQANADANDTGSKAVDSLLNYETVKYFSNEQHESDRYDAALSAHETSNLKSDMTFESVNLGQNLIVGATLTVMTLTSGLHVMNGSLTVGDFVALNAYLLRIVMPLAFLGYVIRELKNSVTNFDDIIALLNEPVEVKDSPNASPLRVDRGLIEFKNVNFGFTQDQQALTNISLTVLPGKSVAIVGHSGSGKSTLSRLLLRLFDVQSGSILIDGQDISKVTQASLRDSMAVVPQDTMLFNETIYYNIAYAKPNAPRDDIIKAAKAAHIHDTIMKLPDGYDTIVGERGLKVSGGEKQRIAIARAILKEPKIFIFDEATSSLDSKTESDIQSNLLEISREVTTLMIAHRLSTITHCEEIIVLENGQIIERGRHHELLTLEGAYAKMWQQQVKHKQE
ncbi:MAG: metal ABC transporter permease [Legionella sp.]|nr:MAG: metal ABC transporter permease [Legionella sp.]